LSNETVKEIVLQYCDNSNCDGFTVCQELIDKSTELCEEYEETEMSDDMTVIVILF
jgi:hypothetical protein